MLLQSREFPPGDLKDWADDALRWGDIDVDAAVSALSHAISRGAATERADAVDGLVWLADDRAISPLVRAMSDPSKFVRRAAAGGLARFYPLPDWALPPLSAALKDPDPATRAGAASSLGSVRHRAAIDDLVWAAVDPSPTVRRQAAWSLVSLGRYGITDTTAAGCLTALLADVSPPVAYAGYWAIRAQGGTRFEGLLADWRWSSVGCHVWRRMVRWT